MNMFPEGTACRICPGLHFSNDALFSLTASVLARFTIEPPKDEFGNPVQLELALMSTNVALVHFELCRTAEVLTNIHCRKPFPFKCTITPRV